MLIKLYTTAMLGVVKKLLTYPKEATICFEEGITSLQKIMSIIDFISRKTKWETYSHGEGR